MLTITDLFCGAGGSSTGATAIPGVEVRIASNHWPLAVETHAANHPTTDHLCADISQIDPRRFPRTNILWGSPECTNHSIARGIKYADAQPDLFGEILPDAAAERSRATMWDIPRFAECHRYQIVIVENVVDATRWVPFRAWLAAMESLGYQHELVFLNSMHAQLFGAGAPQSRDRLYVVFWRNGIRRPELERVTAPAATCPTHGAVRARQVFKRSPEWGRYRAQYTYRCPVPACHTAVEPVFRAAAEIIDWQLAGKRIGDRTKPLAAKTVARIQAGIDRYWSPLLVPVEGREGKQASPVTVPARTMTTRLETGLAFIAELRGGGSVARPVAQPLATVTASGNHHGLVTAYYGNGSTRPASEALSTVTATERHGILTPGRGIDLDDVLFRMLEPSEQAAAMDFPAGYRIIGTRREQVRQAGNAVTPCAARDLIGVCAETLTAP